VSTVPGAAIEEPSVPQSPPPIEDADEDDPVSAPPASPSPFTEPRGYEIPKQGEPPAYLHRPPAYPPMYSNPPYGRYESDRNGPPLPDSRTYGPPPSQAFELNAYGQAPVADSVRGMRVARRLAYSALSLQGGAILWVDDQQEWNEPLIRLFRTAGITVDTVESTEDALRALRERRFDLVITDMRREREPDGDTAGMALLDRMIAAGVPTPAVFFSDHPGAATTIHPRAVIATSDPERLVDTVVDIVGARPRTAAPANWLSRLRGQNA
jgi:CheY-like chemotaxis protein